MQTCGDDDSDGTRRRHRDFLSRFGRNPLLLVGAPHKALLSRSPQRNTASSLARKEDGKVTSAKVKQPGRVTPDIPGTHPHRSLLSRSPRKDYGLTHARVEDGKGARVFREPSHGRSPPSPLW